MQLIKELFARLNPKGSVCKFVLKDWKRLPDLDALSRVLESKRFSENLEPVVVGVPQGKRILVLAPHPDDDVFGAGGTLLKSVQGGAKIKAICVTTGEKEDTRDTVRVREEEARRASEALGAEIEFWRYPTRMWRVDEKIANRLRTAVANWNPVTIVLPFLADDHEDHRRTSELFYRTFRDAPPQGEVWAYQVYSTVLPNVLVDITDVMEEKLRLVRMHQSQMAHRDWAHYLRGLNALNSRFLKTNEPRYAEMFFVVSAREYIELCHRYYAS